MLLDSGATGLFLDDNFVKHMGWKVDDIEQAVPVYNVDGTLDAAGRIRQTVNLFIRYGEHQERATFSITKLGGVKAILGHSWLKHHNPNIDWKMGTVELTRCPPSCRKTWMPLPTIEEDREEYRQPDRDKWGKIEKGDHIFMVDVEAYEEAKRKDQLMMSVQKALIEVAEETDGDIVRVDNQFFHIRAMGSISQQLYNDAIGKEEKPKTFEELVPAEYHQFKSVFTKASFDELPPRRPWDHAIELVPGSEPKSSKVYPMAPDEQRQLDEFLEENLCTGRI